MAPKTDLHRSIGFEPAGVNTYPKCQAWETKVTLRLPDGSPIDFDAVVDLESPCCIISKTLLEEKGCLDSMKLTEATHDGVSRPHCRVGTFEDRFNLVDKPDSTFKAKFCVVEGELANKRVILGRNTVAPEDLTDAESVVKNGAPIQPILAGREKDDKKGREERKRKRDERDERDKVKAIKQDEGSKKAREGENKGKKEPGQDTGK